MTARDPLSDDDVLFFTEELIDTPDWRAAEAIQRMAVELLAARASIKSYREVCDEVGSLRAALQSTRTKLYAAIKERDEARDEAEAARSTADNAIDIVDKATENTVRDLTADMKLCVGVMREQRDVAATMYASVLARADRLASALREACDLAAEYGNQYIADRIAALRAIADGKDTP